MAPDADSVIKENHPEICGGCMKFRSMSPAEFFKKNRHVAGFQNPARAVYQTVKELVENSLDATEPYGILPTVKLRIEFVDKQKGFLKIACQDNGIGVPPSQVPKAFGKVLYGSKYVEKQARGVFGLGIKMAVLYAQMTTGEPVEVLTKPAESSSAYFFKIKIDTRRNEPLILERRVLSNAGSGHGTRVVLVLEGDWGRAKNKVLTYISRMHTLCPYAHFTVKYPSNGKTKFLTLPRASETLPQPPKEIKPHPHGVDLDTFRYLAKEAKAGTTLLSFLIRNFSGVGEKSAKEFLKKLGIPPRKRVKGLTHEELVLIVHEMRNFRWRPPPASALSPVGEENIKVGLKTMFKPEYVVAMTRQPKAYSGHPFQVEVGVAYGGRIQPQEKPVLLRYANKAPLLYDESVDVASAVVSEIDWRSYRVEFPAPLVVLVHVCATKVPYHTLGKEAVADVPEIRSEVKLALQEALRKLRKYLARKEGEILAKKRRIEISKYFPPIASAISAVTGEDEEKVLRLLNSLLEKAIRGGAE